METFLSKKILELFYIMKSFTYSTSYEKDNYFR